MVCLFVYYHLIKKNRTFGEIFIYFCNEPMQENVGLFLNSFNKSL
mgnify:CR=1 FL=1